MDDGFGREGRRTSLVDAVWRHRWLVLGSAILAGVLGFAASFLQTREYSAEAQLILTDPRAAPQALQASRDAQRYIANQAELIESSVVAERASEILDGSPGPQTVQRSVRAAATPTLDLITITAVRPSGQEAAEVANAVGQAYEERVTSTVAESVDAARTQLDQSIQEYETQIAAIDDLLAGDAPSEELFGQRSALVSRLAAAQSQIDQLVVEATIFGSGVQVFERAGVPTSPSNPRPRRNAAAAAVIGLLAASAYAWWRGERTPLADEPHIPAEVLRAPLLGTVPAIGRDGHDRIAAGGPAREAYDFVVSAMDFALDQVGGSVVAVTSPGPGEGRTSTVVNLALAALGDGRNPLLVDADRRRRGLSGLAPDVPGLSELAAGTADLDQCLGQAEVLDGAAELTILPAGSGGAPGAGFFRNAEYKKAMAAIRARGRLTLVDTPPVLDAAEASDIAAQSDAVVMVVRSGTALQALEAARDRLAISGTPLIGYVFSTRRPAGPRLAADDDASVGEGE